MYGAKVYPTRRTMKFIPIAEQVTGPNTTFSNIWTLSDVVNTHVFVGTTVQMPYYKLQILNRECLEKDIAYQLQTG